MGLRDFNGKILPAPDVYDIDGECNPASTVAALHQQGKKVICYLDAGAYETYRQDAAQFPTSVIGATDQGWNGSFWLDIRKVSVLEPIMQARIANCKAKGFDAVEPDELDGYVNNSGFSLTAADQMTYDQDIATWVHAAGLSVLLKGDIDQAAALEPSFDFTLNEECDLYSACSPALDAFSTAGKAVFIAEYPDDSPTPYPVNTAGAACLNAQAKHWNLSWYKLSPASPPGSPPSVGSMSDPPWWHATTIYQVYPRSFADSNGDGIGDLPGLIGHLDHLVDLGIGAVWVSPFFASPQRDVGYDISDYRSIAPEYGTLADAQALIAECHGRGLRVMFDLVLNHTSDQHEWFVESRSSRTNPKADWYVWSDGRGGIGGRRRPPNNWRSELQITRAWQWSDDREQWYLASFLGFQPDLNWRNPDLRAEMFDMIRRWLARGVDGFRLDIFGSIMQDQLLRDNRRRPMLAGGIPRIQTPNRTLNTDDNIALAADLRQICNEFDGDDRILLGEVFGPTSTLRRYLHDGGRDGLHAVFLFDFLAAPYKASRLRSLIERYERAFPAPMQPTYVIENHDRTRSLSRLGGDLDKARVMATLLCTLRGIPVIYQGQEIGMTNRYIPLRDAIDPLPAATARWVPELVNQRLTERLNRDEVRTPMQWNGSPGAGFCDPEVTPWLPVGDNVGAHNVATEGADPTSLLSWYRQLLHLRRHHPALHRGSLTLIDEVPGDVIAYHRSAPDDQASVYANLGAEPTTITVDADATVTVASHPQIVLDRGRLRLPANAAVVLTDGPGHSMRTPSTSAM
jgi:glycosidase